MLNKEQESLIKKSIVLFKNSVLNNIEAQDLFLSNVVSNLPLNIRIQTKLKEVEGVQDKVNKAMIENNFPIFSQREKIIFINILNTVIRQLESMVLILPVTNIEQGSNVYNQKIFETQNSIKELILLFK